MRSNVGPNKRLPNNMGAFQMEIALPQFISRDEVLSQRDFLLVCYVQNGIHKELSIATSRGQNQLLLA